MPFVAPVRVVIMRMTTRSIFFESRGRCWTGFLKVRASFVRVLADAVVISQLVMGGRRFRLTGSMATGMFVMPAASE